MKKLLFILLLFACAKKNAPQKEISWQQTQFVQNGFTLNWESNDNAFSIGIKKQLVETFFKVYPQLVKDFNTAAPKEVYFKIDTTYNGVAATSGNRVVYNPNWFYKNPKDIDVVTHEVMHIVQGYPAYDPWWLVEGIADYARYKYGVANAEGGWSLPNVAAGQKYDNGYRVTARFLVWCEQKKSGLVQAIDASLRANSYKSSLWKSLTGYTIDELWAAYISNPAI